MKRKGQAAMEFLMTYGWAILVVLAAIGALAYFGILNPRGLLPDKCNMSGLGCTEVVVNSGVVNFYMNNHLGFDIRLTDMDLYDSQNTDMDCTEELGIAGTGPAAVGTGNENVGNGQAFQLRFSSCTETVPGSGQGFSGTFQVAYENNQNGADHNPTGEFSAKVE